MLFTLEALQAQGGDCLVLLYGAPRDPRVIVIDGGPTKAVFRRLRARLDALRAALDLEADGLPLDIELLMVSHIDDDHIDGILHLTRLLLEERNDPPFAIVTLWHNAFDDLLGNSADELSRSAGDAVREASAGAGAFDQSLVRPDTALVLASVNQGRELRDNATRLGLTPPLLVARPGERRRDFGSGLTLRVVGPREEQVRALQDTWEAELRRLAREGRLGGTEAASFADRSAANLASLVVLAEADGRSMLLTGDARGDYLVDSLREQDLLVDGRLHVDLFKLPHHGSDRNVERSTFETITADHYVISGDGHHGNPEVATFEMLFGGRVDAGLLDRPFTLHLTYAPQTFRADRGAPYPLARLLALFEDARTAGHRFEVVHPVAGGEELVRVELGESLAL
ncbi:MAG: hypothetical protein AAGC60_24470 [Acidobacteriota bacterium]